MAGGTVYSGFDFGYGFWQVPVAEESQEISTLRSPVEAMLVFDVLMMGWNTSPADFHRVVKTYVRS